MFIHNYSHTFFLLLRGPISQVVLHDCRQRDVSQTLMSIHGWVRGFRMCKTSSLQLLLGQFGSHPSEELENVHWSRGAWNQQHGSFLSSLPIVESLVRGWLLALVLHLAVAYTSHFIRAKSKEQSCCSISNEDMLTRDFENGSSLTRLLETMNLPSSLLACDALTAHSKTCTMPRPRQSLSLLR